jgi:hypothetical protein
MTRAVHLIIKEIVDFNIGLFVIAETDDITYKINPDAEQDEHIIECFSMLGKVIGKAIFERIQINSYFDKTIVNYVLDR